MDIYESYLKTKSLEELQRELDDNKFNNMIFMEKMKVSNEYYIKIKSIEKEIEERAFY